MNISPRENISWEEHFYQKTSYGKIISSRKKYIMGRTFHISSRQNTVLYLLGRTFPLEKHLMGRSFPQEKNMLWE